MQIKLTDKRTQPPSQEAQSRERYVDSPIDIRRPLVVTRDQLPLILSLLQLVLFGWLTWWVRKHPVAAIDIKISQRLQKNQSPLLRYTTQGVSFIGGSPKLLPILAFPVALGLWWVRLRLEAMMMLAITLTGTLAKKILHRSINRPRPSPMLVHVVEGSHGKSFPSGHVISSLTFWGWLTVLARLLVKEKRPAQRFLFGIPPLLMGLVGAARVYLGDHWASDVLGGYLFGGAWLGLFLQLYQALMKKYT